MFGDRAKPRRTDRWAFRPTLDGRLEPKILLSGSANAAQGRGGKYQGGYHFQVAYGGQAVQIRTPNDGVFVASMTNLTGTTAGAGTIRARAVPGDPQHRVDLYVNNSTSQSVLTIDTRGQAFTTHKAHDPNPATINQDSFLNVRNIYITNRKGAPTAIGQILGYHSANLSGSITTNSISPVDRIAFNSIGLGTKVSIAGDVNTLDVVQSVTLGVGDYFHIGRDLNASQIGGDIVVGNGGQFTVGRDTGAIVQPVKGSEPAYPSPVALLTGTGNVGSSTLFITNVLGGDLDVNVGGLFSIGRAPQNQFLIHGRVNLNGGTFSANGVTGPSGLGQFIKFPIPGTIPQQFFPDGTGTILIMGGITQNGVVILPGQTPLAVSTTTIVSGQTPVTTTTS